VNIENQGGQFDPLNPPNGMAVDGLDADASGDVNLDVILEVPVTLSLEVGRTRIPIRNLLQLNQGSVVELDRAAAIRLALDAAGPADLIVIAGKGHERGQTVRGAVLPHSDHDVVAAWRAARA